MATILDYSQSLLPASVDPGDPTILAPPPGFGEDSERPANSAGTSEPESNTGSTSGSGIRSALQSFCSEMLEQRPSYTG